MIVRISSEGQYRIPGAFLDQLNALDNRIVEVVGEGDEAEFRNLFAEMLSLIRKEGTPLGPDEIAESELILPPPDTSLNEARKLFTGDGLIPG